MSMCTREKMKFERATWVVGHVDGRVQVLKDRDGICRDVSMLEVARLARVIQGAPAVDVKKLTDWLIAELWRRAGGWGVDHALGEVSIEDWDELRDAWAETIRAALDGEDGR